MLLASTGEHGPRGAGDAAGARRTIDEVLRIDSAHPEARALLRTLEPEGGLDPR